MNSKHASSWFQILYGLGYGSIMGLGFGMIFYFGLLGGVWVLSRIIYMIAFRG